MNVINDFCAHYAAGITLSFADRLFSRNAKKNTEKRVEEKTKQVAALDYIRGIQSDATNRDSAVKSKDYLEAIVTARSYFRGNGVQCENYEKGFSGFMDKVCDKVSSYKDSERFNNMNAGRKLGTAFALEFVIDSGVVVSQALFGLGNGLSAFASTTLWQAPGLFFGMQTGKYALKVKDYFARSKEEKALDDMAKEITADGKLLEIVRTYSPTVAVEVPKSETDSANAENAGTAQSKGDYVSELGKKAGEQASVIAGKVASGAKKGFDVVLSEVRKIAEQRAAAANAKKEEQEKQRAQWRSRYDKY